MPDIQKLIDQLFLKNPKIKEYIEWAKYVPQGEKIPEGATHRLALASLANGADIVVALRVDGPYDVLVDALLTVL